MTQGCTDVAEQASTLHPIIISNDDGAEVSTRHLRGGLVSLWTASFRVSLGHHFNDGDEKAHGNGVSKTLG